MIDSREIALLQSCLAGARKAQARYLTQAPTGVILADPACDRGCSECTLKCACVTNTIADLERQLREANADPVFMMFDGVEYRAVGGVQ